MKGEVEWGAQGVLGVGEVDEWSVDSDWWKGNEGKEEGRKNKRSVGKYLKSYLKNRRPDLITIQSLLKGVTMCLRQ